MALGLFAKLRSAIELLPGGKEGPLPSEGQQKDHDPLRPARVLTRDSRAFGSQLIRDRRYAILLDLEAEDVSADELSSPWDERGPADQMPAVQTPVVLLGSVRREGDWPVAEYVSKPYHYGPLIRKIESILSR